MYVVIVCHLLSSKDPVVAVAKARIVKKTFIFVDGIMRNMVDVRWIGKANSL
jgi:hypothetical protein